MATLEYLIRATDQASGTFSKVGLSADKLDRQLGDLGRRIASPTVDLNDKQYALKMAEAAVKLDRLAKKVANPKVTPEGLRSAELGILRLGAMVDELDGKTATVTVDVDRRRGIFSRLGGLFGGVKGPSGLGTGIAGLGQAGPAALGIGGALLASVAPALIPFGLGLGAGGGAALGAASLGKQAADQLAKLNKSLASAQGAQRKALQAQIKALEKSSGPELAIFSALQDVGIGAKGAFTRGLEARGAGGAPSFLTGLTGILKQLGGFVDKLGPGLGRLFRASLPFLEMFVKLLERSAKSLLPVFTQSLKQMTPYLPILMQGFMLLTEGVAGFIKNLGPGMRSAAVIFKGAMEVVKGMLQLIGFAASSLANGITGTGRAIRTFARNLPQWFDDARHQVAVIFDAMRHGIAATWNTIFNNTIGRIAAGLSAVVNDFKALPGRVLGALEGLGTSLYDFGHMALSKLWNGMKAVFGSVWGWFKSLPGKLLHAIGINSPPDWAIDAGRHIMGGILHGITSRKNELQNAFAGSVKFSPGLGVAQWAGLVRRALAMEGLSPSLAGRVLYQMMTESGGNPMAVNMTDINARMGDPSKGLMQVIGSTFQAYHWPGTSWNVFNPLANIAAALNYARHVYGPSLMSGGMGIGSGHGYALGGLIREPIVGVGRSGQMYTFGENGPETVIPGRRGAGPLVNIEQMVVQDATDIELAAQKLSFRIIAAGLGS